MPSLADKVLDRVADIELLLEELASDSLNIVLVQGTFEKFARDTKLLVQLIWQVKDDLRGKVYKIPSLKVFELGLGWRVEARRRIESVANELKLAFTDCHTKTERVELEVSGCSNVSKGLGVAGGNTYRPKSTPNWQ